MERRILDTLAELGFTSRSRLSELVRREGIDLPPFLLRVLSIVGRFPDHNQQQLLQRRGHDKGQVARAFKQLEQQGLIYRSGSSTPRRITQVTLTEEGQRLFCRLEAARSELASQALSGFAPQEVRKLNTLLERMLENVDNATD
ncbi:MarR family winged helix-turn-helix transcriptional regulator [Halomonas elongata]|uniref:MarR family transcription regulator n=1 Tax=Halomonas elongata (strain ATCC 33173 / DSM 2581 / NBRC 15536 / NCIMB 2198 / 1H9) TaxID=768066 RepID=E1VCF4_HALED|nr:MarR family winged helix-turn-helix transcriptional regulator [Halomonas elongata]MBW5800309.1 MarR family winged helix-turn-helix transcriptional regulator [Halomonas elongata]MDL4861524.1 MarR family winged helix-turn-helix transcriptional regulator [Halomonas elongata]RAW08595.1 MarR family transcriptional regulator [Halomonas elongata]WPU46946.1 MarR family winged helix-turn-helix transcriptional regulator [Halomonas elongata DSM 2581]CBV44324.1 MarR family transcription regulator [Halo